MKPIVISYFTKDTLYEKEAAGLISSCEDIGVEYHVEGVKDLGRWDKNCCFKPTFILQKLQELQRPIFWIDSDAMLFQKLSHFDQADCDLSIYEDFSYPENHKFRMRSGSLFINYTKAAIRLLKCWKKECEKKLKENKEEVWDQAVLSEIIHKKQVGLRWEKMPLSYCRILCWTKDYLPEKETVICHFQASRLYKQIINKEMVQFSFLDHLTHEKLKEIRHTLKGFVHRDLNNDELPMHRK